MKIWTLLPCGTEASPFGCDYTGATPLCCNDTCVVMPTVGCADVANYPCTDPQVCDYCANPPACVDPPATCDPACGADAWCDGTTCKPIPVCIPACGANEVCAP